MEFLQSEHEVECYYALLSTGAGLTSNMYNKLFAYYNSEGFLVAHQLLVYICNTLGLYPTPPNYAEVQEYRNTSYPNKEVCNTVKRRFMINRKLHYKVKAVAIKYRILNATTVQDKANIIVEYYIKRRRNMLCPRLKAGNFIDVGHLVKILNSKYLHSK